VLAAGLGTLKLPPAVFWSLTLPEWRALTIPHRPAALSRQDLLSLIERYPD
jgi:uncharacterized phage protein (TIGR02216 family)